LELFEKNSYKYKTIVWGGGGDISPKFIPRLRDRKLLNLFLITAFNFWLITKLLIVLRKNDVVFSVDLDTRFAVYIVQFFNRHIKVIYDIADPFSLSRLNGKLQFLDGVESYMSRASVLTIFPSEARSKIFKIEKNILIVENVPFSHPVEVSSMLSDRPLVIGYFGSLEPEHRLLEVISSVVVSSSAMKMVVGGSGGLTKYFEKLSKEFPEKINFVGKFKHDQLDELLVKCHMNMACYSMDKKHHNYLASNKQYEHLMLQKPCLTNAGTSLADFVKKYNTGWVIEESAVNEESILELFDLSHYDEKVNNCQNTWKKYYENYWQSSEAVRKLTSVLGTLNESN
jgi:hypothetical protein